jgi:predicted RNA polymerase sigma factor
VIDDPTRRLDEDTLRALVPQVLAALVRRGEDFDTAEDALQEALIEALRVWPEHPPHDPCAWLATLNWWSRTPRGPLPDHLQRGKAW